MSTQLQVYPRGFVGAQLTAYPDRELPAYQIARAALQYDARIFHKSHKDLVYDIDVSRLYDDQTLISPYSHTFEFKEEVFKKAMIVFGTRTLNDWVEVQSKIPGTSKTHLSFIEDTVKHVLFGDERRMYVSIWKDMLNNEVDIEPVQYKTWNDLIYALNTYNRSGVLFSTLVDHWVYRSMSDLVESLNLLFGRFQ